MGILPLACMKVRLVMLFGIMCAITKKVASPTDWKLPGNLLLRTLIALVALYSFIMTWNIILWI